MTTKTPTFPKLRADMQALRDQHEEAQKIYLDTLADEAEALPLMHHTNDQCAWLDITAMCVIVRNAAGGEIMLAADGDVRVSSERPWPLTLDATLLDVMRRELSKAQARAESGAS